MLFYVNLEIMTSLLKLILECDLLVGQFRAKLYYIILLLLLLLLLLLKIYFSLNHGLNPALQLYALE